MMLIPNNGLLIENILCKETQYLLVKGYLVDPAYIMYQKYCGVHKTLLNFSLYIYMAVMANHLLMVYVPCGFVKIKFLS